MLFLISFFFNALLSNYIERSNMKEQDDLKNISVFGSKTSSLAIEHHSRTVKGLLSFTTWSFPVKMTESVSVYGGKIVTKCKCLKE